MSLTRKAINFDLSTNELKKHFNNTAEAYNKIKEFMLDNGFEHRQKSGYASIEPMGDKQINLLTRRLANKFTWLKDCIQEFDVTDIGEQYSLNHIFKADKTFSKEISQNKTNKESQIQAMKAKVKEFAFKNNKSLQPSKDKSNELDR